MGKKKYPIYKLVAADIRSPRNGRFIESVGQYDPNVSPVLLDLKEERIMHWLNKGAQPTDTVRSLLRRKGLWLRWSMVKRGADEANVLAVMAKWQMQQDDKAKREADRKARHADRKKKKAAAAEAPAAGAPTPEAPATEAPAPTA